MPCYVKVRFPCGLEGEEYSRWRLEVGRGVAPDCENEEVCRHIQHGLCWSRVTKVRVIRPMKKARRQTQAKEA